MTKCRAARELDFHTSLLFPKWAVVITLQSSAFVQVWHSVCGGPPEGEEEPRGEFPLQFLTREREKSERDVDASNCREHSNAEEGNRSPRREEERGPSL